MQKSAVIVHLDCLASVTPLVGGYLKAYAYGDPAVREDWSIELYSESSSAKASRVIRDLVERAPDLVAFSVYTWNAGLVQRLLPALRGILPPETHFLLGGVEVMNVAERFVDPSWTNVAVCNGEGEQTFRAMLLELSRAKPRLGNVGGITYPSEEGWCTTQGEPRITDLTKLPSPWLSGAFHDVDVGEVALFETNRGCPFFCEFCYWGGMTGQKIYQQDLERIEAELAYIAGRGIRAISLCDANFGILPRDVEIAKHIAALAKEHKGLTRVLFNSSKVLPDRVEEISRILCDAGLLTRHAFSLQSMNERVLKIARRTSLERGPYEDIQRRLNERRMSSIIELLWPMPGETLETFKEGVDDLCRMGAQSFLIFPLIWLNNTGYEERTDEHGVITLPEDDANSGGRIVVQTNDVSFQEYLDGLQFAMSLYVLHDCRGLYATMQLLDTLGIARVRDVLDAFGLWMDEHASGPFAERWDKRLECFEDMASFTWRGILGDAVLNVERKEIDRLLLEFAATQSHWTTGAHAALIEEAIEYDLLARPYTFLQTPFGLGAPLEHIQIAGQRSRVWQVRMAFDLPRLVDGLRVGRAPSEADLEPGDYRVEIDHRANQLFLLPSRTESEHHWLCTLAVQEIARIEPRCSTERAERVLGPASAS